MSDAVEGIGWRYDWPRFDGRARCAETDPDAFFPDQGGSVREAKKVCASCEVTAECLAWALEHGEIGVWGGTSEKERRRLSRPKPSRGPLPINHGTTGGYRAHFRRGEKPCPACAEANSVARPRNEGAA